MRKLLALALAWLTLAGPALAANQKPLIIKSGQVQQIPSTDTLALPAASTINASLNLPHGTAPTSPTNGDMWSTTAGLYVRINGATVGPLSAGGSPGGSSGQVQYNNAGAFGGFTLSGDCTLVTSTGVVTCTKTSGSVFAASATTDATNASNISSGTLGSARLPTSSTITWSGKQTLSGGADVTPETTPTTTAVGYLGAPVNTQNGTYSLALTDDGGVVYHTSGSAHTYTIPANASVAFPVGTVIIILNENGGGNITLAITSDTLRWGSTTGSRTIAANGSATLIKVTSTLWRLLGDGIT